MASKRRVRRSISRETIVPPKEMTPERREYERLKIRWLNLHMKYTDREITPSPLLKRNYKRATELYQQARHEIQCPTCQGTGFLWHLGPGDRPTCPDCKGFGIHLKHILCNDDRKVFPFGRYDMERLDQYIFGYKMPREPRNRELQEKCRKWATEQGHLSGDEDIMYPTREQGLEYWGDIEKRIEQDIDRPSEV